MIANGLSLFNLSTVASTNSGITPDIIPNLLAWYEPQLDSLTIGVPTTTTIDHSGNGYDITWNADVEVVEGPNSGAVLRLATDRNGSNVSIPFDTNSHTVIFAGYVESGGTSTSHWRWMIYASSVNDGTAVGILNGIPNYYGSGRPLSDNAINPRGSFDEWYFWAVAGSASASKGWTNSLSLTGSGPLSFGSQTGLSFFNNIGGSSATRLAGLYIYDRALSDVEINKMRAYCQTALGTPAAPSTASPLLVVEGDSITHGIAANTIGWAYRVPTYASGWQVRDRSQISSTIADATERITFVDPLYSSSRVKNVFASLLGTNNYGLLAQITSEVYNNLTVYLQSRKNVGFITVQLGLLERSDTTVDTEGLNNLLRADFPNAVSGLTNTFSAGVGVTYADYFIDLTADTRFQDPGDTTYFQDQLHITDVAQTIIAQEYIAPLLASL